MPDLDAARSAGVSVAPYGSVAELLGDQVRREFQPDGVRWDLLSRWEKERWVGIGSRVLDTLWKLDLD